MSLGRPDTTRQPNKLPTQRTREKQLYPSVQYLLHANNLLSEASRITSTGPNGQLTKGDVLAYMGKVDKDYIVKQSQRLKSLSSLNISGTAPQSSYDEKKEKKEGSDEVRNSNINTAASIVEVSIPITLDAVQLCQRKISESLGKTIPLSTFIKRASNVAFNELSSQRMSRNSDIFDDIIGVKKMKDTRNSFSPRVEEVDQLSSRKRNDNNHQVRNGDLLDYLMQEGPISWSRKEDRSRNHHKSDNRCSSYLKVEVLRADKFLGNIFLKRLKHILEIEPDRVVVL